MLINLLPIFLISLLPKSFLKKVIEGLKWALSDSALSPTLPQSPPPTPTHPHPPKIMSHLPPVTITNPKYFRTHPHLPDIFSHQTPPTQNNAWYTPIHSHPTKIFSQPLPPTQNNTPTTPQLPKKFLISSPANLICSPIQNSSSTVPNDPLITRLSNLTN